MNLLGLSIRRQKHLSQGTSLSPVGSRGGWFPFVREAWQGAWQQNVEIRRDDVLTSGVVFACMTLIAGDIAKLWLDLVEDDAHGISTPIDVPAFSPVLKKPNHYQNRIQFMLCWVLAKLTYGNTYVLKRRDGRSAVTDLYVLDSSRVTPLVAPDGSVFYQLQTDYLSGLTDVSELIVPAREIIHDLMYPLYHPLVGISPIAACGLAATQSLKIQNQSATAFQNNLLLAGVLTAPGPISQQSAEKIERHWNEYYGGEAGRGKVAAIGDGLKFDPMVSRPIDQQLVEQLRWTGEDVCRCFHVPPYKVGVGPAPTYNNIEALSQEYYAAALQILIESIELCLDEGLALPKPYRTEFDLDALLRMDTATAVDTATKGIIGGLFKPNEGRAKLNYKPVEGGDACYLQQQQYSLAALSRRDQAGPPPPTDPLIPVVPQTGTSADAAAKMIDQLLADLKKQSPLDEERMLTSYRMKAAALGLSVDHERAA